MKRFIFVIFILNVMIHVLSQDATPDNWIEKSEILKKESLARDIAKADFNHLKAMAMSLGLKDEDNAASYRNSLCKYYGITLIQEQPQKGEKIILEKAGELKMIKFKEDDEENLHIIGRAKIILSSKDSDNKPVSRSIEADSIYIDLNNKEITGVGNIVFKDNTLEFNGNQFYYNFRMNRGVLFGGKTKILSSGSSGLKDAFFDGERIVQTDKDDSILYNGNLTTCDEDDPHYYIKVSRIWISQKGEWGILNGIVYVGKTPFWYLPFYYHPRDFFLNPSMGFKSREGWYINTTYFALGEKFEVTGIQNEQNKDSTVLSGVDKNRAINQKAFLTITKADLDQKLREFYAKSPFYEKHPEMKIFPNFNSVNLSLRLFADAYTNLGFYTGAFFYMKYDRTNSPVEISFLSDYGFSRKLYKDAASDLYYPYNPNDRENIKNISPLQFRSSQWFKMVGSLSNTGIMFNYNLQLEYASDASFFEDFYSRNLSFSYIDLLADTLKYAVQSQKNKYSNFTFQSDVSSDSKEDISTYIDIGLSPQKYPNIFGLNIISSFSIDTKTEIKMKKSYIPNYAPTAADGYAEDPLYQRYMIEYFQIPDGSLSMKGTLLNYDVFLKMPDNYYSTKKANSDPDEKAYKDLFTGIDKTKNMDVSKDQTVMDYKILVSFFSKKNQAKSKSGNDIFKFNDVLFFNENSYYMNQTDNDNDEGTEKGDVYSKIKTVDLNKNVTNPGIKFISFNLDYSLSDSLTSTFRFVRDKYYPPYEYDSFQKLLTNYDNSYLQGYNLTSKLNFSLTGYYKMFEFSNSSLWRTSPVLTIYYNKRWDDSGIYMDYLERIYPGASYSATRQSEELSLINTNKQASEFSIYYEDVVNNDLSFGNYLINGTGLATSMKFKLFKDNELREDKFSLLNSLNINNSALDYQEYDPVQYYDNRAGYEKIEYLYSRFTLNFNCFPEDSSHKLSVSMAPKINWIITKTGLATLKNNIWDKYSSEINYLGYMDVSEEAKDYLCYRTNGHNLYDELTSFYENLFTGPNNYRKIFEDVTITQKYSYKYKDYDLIVINNSLIFKLVNIGGFSKGTPDLTETYFGVFPDDNFSISLFKSVFNYSFAISFDKSLNSYAVNSSISDFEKTFDQYNVMTFANTHTFNLSLPGTLFPVQLPKGNWVSFTSSTVFKWDPNIRWHTSAGDPDPNQYYLYSQSISTSILMDIFKFTLNFNAFDYKDYGYAFELNNGKIDVGYTVTEIPIFWNVFKFNIAPKVSFEFYTARKGEYYEGSSLLSFNSSYYSNNILSASLMMELIIGANTDFETKIHFEIASQNSKMYLYYVDEEGKSPGAQLFFEDLGKSFNFGNVEDRRQSNFKLKSILLSVEHKLHDWNLKFQYTGSPQKSDLLGRYYWENNFSFEVVWNIQSENQLMKMFNKTKINNTYEKGEWKQPVLSLDPDEK